MIFGTNIYSYAYLRYARGMGTMILGVFTMSLPIRHKYFGARDNIHVMMLPLGLGCVLFALREWRLANFPHSKLRLYIAAGAALVLLGLIMR